MKRLLALSLSTWLITACTEDLTPITKTWNDTLAKLTAQHGDVMKVATELKARTAAFVPPADDKDGQALRGKLDAAFTSLDQGITDAQASLTSGATAVNEAITKGKVAGVQAAMDKVKADVGVTLEKVKSELKSTEALVAEAAKQVADAAKRARAAAAAAEAPPTVDATKAGEADYEAIDFKAGTDELALDKPAVKANLDALVALLSSCEAVQVEVEGHTSKVGEPKANKELSAKRAQAVTRYLIKEKVSPSKIKKTYGYGSEKPAMEEPDPGSEAEKAMEPAKLRAVRERNERIHLRILKPCPAGK
ncbi:MAG: OmpA family protein [Myxococcaceae bacterium]|nr:OmpA family protein [Myxococcaceae bacterium]